MTDTHPSSPAPADAAPRLRPRTRSGWGFRPLALLPRLDGGYLPGGVGVVDRDDRLASFAPAVLAIRWCMTSASLAVAGGAFVSRDWEVVAWCAAVIGYTVVRTISPIRYVGNRRSLAEVLGETAFHVAVAAATGSWDSPFVFSLMTAIVVGGFARGFGFGLRIGMGAAVSLTLVDLAGPDFEGQDLRVAAQWTIVLALVGVVAGYARRISGEADRQYSIALDRLDRLSDANALLFSLHRVAQTLPASLDLGDVLDSTVARLRGLVDFDSVAILVFDDTDRSWQVIRREGASLPNRLGPTELPTPLMDSLSANKMVQKHDLVASEDVGISPNSSSGLYTVLSARGSVIGLLAVESRRPGAFGRRETELLNGFVEPVALAIDNARWFSRLRTVGADEERTRIARDLHDNIGQSLAYVAFELDRVAAKESKGEDLEAPLAQVRQDLRNVIGEVRDTLYDLRTDVSDGQEIGAVLEQFATRLMDRSDLEIEVRAENGRRLPLLQEREMWRIAQEALVNVERHAEARHAMVRWRCDGEAALLEVSDDGKGFPAGDAGRVDSYGIVGMRERASSVGATFEIESGPGGGTVVRCRLPVDGNAVGQSQSE